MKEDYKCFDLSCDEKAIYPRFFKTKNGTVIPNWYCYEHLPEGDLPSLKRSKDSGEMKQWAIYA